MRKVRNAQPSSHSFVFTFVAFLLLTASPLLSAPHPKVTVQKAAEPVRNEYLITLNVPAADVPKVATELTKRYGGEVLAVWQHAVKGFWLKAEPEVARHMVQDRRIKSCEENALGHDSAVPQATGSNATPGDNQTYEELGDALHHYLWHLDRISHRQKPVASADFNYAYGSNGSGVSIYIIDSGVLRWHQEFYETPGPSDPALTQALITQDATDKIDRSPRIRSEAAANMDDGRLAPTYVADDSLGKDPINNGDPIAPVGDCVNPTPYDFPATAANLTHGTACASVAAGRNVGVAKGATIVPVRVFNCHVLDNLGAVISGLDWTLTDVQHQQMMKTYSWNYPAVVSMSIFFTARPDGKLIDILDGTTVMGTGIKAVGQPLGILNETITKLTDYGVPVVVSANNQNNNACLTAPANLSIRAGGHVISVGGLSKGEDKRWVAPPSTPTEERQTSPGSNYGRCVDIWAPAEAIELATMGPKNSSKNGIAYRSIGASGTSFSAPIVAGIIARLMSENRPLVGRDKDAVTRIYNLLTSSATRLPDNEVTDALGEDSPNRVAYIGGVQITRQPASFKFNGNTDHDQMSISIAPSPFSYTYQWYKGDKPGDPAAAIVGGETSAILKRTATQEGSYWVHVEGTCYDGIGTCSADSIAATAGAGDCSLEVRAQAQFLTRVIPSGPPVAGSRAQPIDPRGALIVARAAGQGPYMVLINGASVGQTELELPTTAPDGQPQSVKSVFVDPPFDNDPLKSFIYTVTFADPNTNSCMGQTTVTVSTCPQPRIAFLQAMTQSSPYLWKKSDDAFGLDPDPAHTTVSELDAKGVVSDTAFQWFFGGYDSPTPLAGGRGLNAVPFHDGQYWARVDGRYGWAVTPLVNVVSCFMYLPGSVRIAPPCCFTPVAAGRPLHLAAKLIGGGEITEADHYSWTSPQGGNAGLPAFPSGANIVATPIVAGDAFIQYDVTATKSGGTCDPATGNTGVVPVDCTMHLSLERSWSDGPVLTVRFATATPSTQYHWFDVSALGEWDAVTQGPKEIPGIANHPETIRAVVGHTYFVRVVGACGNVSGMIEDSDTVTVTSSPARTHASFTPLSTSNGATTYYVFAANEDSVTLSAPNWLPNASYTWHSQRDGQAVETHGTGLELIVHRIDVAPHANDTPPPTSPAAATYWVTALDSTGPQDSATIRLVVMPQVVAPTVADPAVTIHAFPGTVIGTESTLQLSALQPVDSTPYPVGTTFEWRAALANHDTDGNDDGTFSKSPNSAVLNSDPYNAFLSPGPIDGHAAYWVRVNTLNGPIESDVVLIIVNCDPQPPSVAISLDRVDHHLQKDVPVIFSAGSLGRNLIYQWYSGPQGDVSHPVGSGGGALWTTSPDGPYWVHATDDCGRAAEASTTVYLCTPTIPDNVSPPDIWIKSGDWAHLSVTATPAKPGDVLHYKWYPGNLNLPALADRTDRTLDVNYTGSFLATVTSDCSDGNHSDVVSAVMTVRLCTAPTILGLSPASHDTRLGTTEVLHVTSSGDALTYQWYRGLKDDVSNPIPEVGTTAALSVQPTVDSDYWVRVTDHGACSTSSESIHLTVCAPPAIATQPAGSTVISGQTVTLTVAATPLTPAPLHYTWFEVAANGSQNAVSGNDSSPSFTTPALTTDRTWFVRVYSGSQLMTYTDSQPVTIHVCAMPAVTWAGAPTPLRPGDPYTLLIVAPPAGSQMYWYRGVSGDVAHSTLIGGPDEANYKQVTPDAPSTSYWVRVQKDSCYSDAPTFTLNVCIPTITQQPAGGPIIAGGSVTLSVAATTSPLTYEWYKGASGDRSQPIAGATGATYTASPTADTLYWVRVIGSCGVAESNATLVSVCDPPAITWSSPTQWAVIGSGSTTVSVNTTGSNLSYQWYFGNSGNTASPMSATTSSVTVTPQNTTTYWVRVSGSCGTPKDSVSMLVNVCGSPAITAHPQGSTINSGATATLSVAATEATTTPMTYQWYLGVSGDTTTPVGNGLTTFTTPALTAATSYWVRVSCGACNPADSQTATVAVCNNAQPLAAPADQFIGIGQTATLSTAPATGNVYQWYIGASGNTSQPAPGTANQSSYAASPSVTTQYWVQIQNGVCTFRTLSATVNVCVPAITQQPASIMINPGASTTLSVAANTSGLTYQWYVGNSGTTTSPISGATASTVTVSPTTATNYWVRVTGSCSQSVNSTTATVTICAPPAINGFSPTQSIVRNNSASCFVTATGTNLTYQWYVGASGVTTTPISGATSSSVSVTPQNTTSYWVRVTGTCGTVNSATMVVNVCASPSITAQPQGSIIFSGGTATMSVTATEGTTTAMTYQWYRGASSDTSAPVGTGTSFTTPALTAQTSYWVRVSCGVCNPADSQAATISICYYPQNLSSPGDFYNSVGQTVRLYTSNAAGNTYQWYSGASGDTSHPYTSPYSPNMYYADVAPSATTQYWAQVQNGGCISRTAAANVYVCIPTFMQQPASVTIAPGSATTLSASANTAGVTYQWYTGASGNTAAPIGGATGPSVTVTPASNTSYWVRAIGTCGRTTDSAAATVTLCSPPVITAQPMGSVVQGGGAIASMWVSATGSNLTYQWYSGNTGDMSNPIDGATASTASMWTQATQKVWVRITGSCGAVNSNATFVSVYPAISQQPPSSLVVGYDTTASISLAASGSYLSYVWKNSQTGVVIATTTTPTLITPSITANTSIYCQVASGNATVNAYETALTVCYNQPNVTLVKAPNGACKMLYTTTNTADDYQWYQGARGDTSHLLGSGGTALTVCPTVPTQYWVRAIVWSSYQVVSCYTDSNAVTAP